MEGAMNLDALNEKLNAILAAVQAPKRGAVGAEEAAEYLGVSKDTVYRLVHRGELRCRREGRLMLFRPDWLDEWMEKESGQ